MYDCIIIGGGIAGLYMAYYLSKHRPQLKFCVLEQNDRLGGRTSTQMFEGVEVVCGAGIGRKGKDTLLIKLLRELNVPYREFTAQHHYAKGVSHPITEQLKLLKKAAPEQPRLPFKTFAKGVLGKEDYHTFVVANGYSDFEKADARDVLSYYGMEDNRGRWTGLSIPWQQLTEALVQAIGSSKIHLSTKVQSLETINDTIKVHCMNDKTYQGRQVICATTIESLRTLFPKHKIYHQIHGQPFLRLYAKVDEATSELLLKQIKGLTVVDSPLQEIIPIAPEQGIYMIAYSDNQSADYLYKKLNQVAYFESEFERALSLPKGSVKILKTQPHYWTIGTHYYSPLPKRFIDRRSFIHQAQRPMTNVWVVGEVVALDQGWVEGALESIETILTDL